MLGEQWQWAGGRVFCGEGRRGERDAGRAGFVVCGCDALFVWCAGWRRRVKVPVHACCGVRVELGSCDGGSWIGTSARCVLWVLVGAWDVGACLRCALAAFECSGVSWTGCDVEE